MCVSCRVVGMWWAVTLHTNRDVARTGREGAAEKRKFCEMDDPQ